MKIEGSYIFRKKYMPSNKKEVFNMTRDELKLRKSIRVDIKNFMGESDPNKALEYLNSIKKKANEVVENYR